MYAPGCVSRKVDTGGASEEYETTPLVNRNLQLIIANSLAGGMILKTLKVRRASVIFSAAYRRDKKKMKRLEMFREKYHQWENRYLSVKKSESDGEIAGDSGVSGLVGKGIVLLFRFLSVGRKGG